MLQGHTDMVFSISISRNDLYIVSASNDKTIRIWDRRNKIQESILVGHDGGILGVAITSDDQYIISSSNDRSVRIWNFQDG